MSDDRTEHDREIERQADALLEKLGRQGMSARMNEEVGRRWVETLRSGQYKQGIEALSQDGTHCCLGVLCELAVEAGVVGRFPGNRPGNGDAVVFGETQDDSNFDYLPTSVAEWSGLSDVNPEVEYEGETRRLSDLNDGITDHESGGTVRLTHPQIADLIESQLLGGAR